MHGLLTDLPCHSQLVITNLPENHCETFQAKKFPGRSEDIYPVPLTRIVYIEETDFKESDEKDYFGLAPGKSIMLRYAYVVKYVSHVKDPSSGRVTEVHVEADLEPAGKKPPKGVLNWVSQPSPGQNPPTAEARIYDYLFKTEDPTDLGDGWLEDMNKESLEVVQGMMLSPALAKASVGDKFQLERLGYFCVDLDSKPSEGKMVFNRTVSLRESFPKFK
jgi:glutaminyl-tRNA synthetase